VTPIGIKADTAPFWCIWKLVSNHWNYAKIASELGALKPAYIMVAPKPMHIKGNFT